MKKPIYILLILSIMATTLVSLSSCVKTKEEAPTEISSDVVRPPKEESSSSSESSSSYSLENKQALDDICAKGREFYSQKQYAKAITELKKALVIDPHFVPALELLSVSCNFSNLCADSVDYASAIIEATPKDSNGYYYKGLAYKAWKKLDESIEWFTKATEINPKDVWSYYGIATIYADTNRKEPALEYLKKAIDILPDVKKTALEQDFHWQDYYTDSDFIALTK